MILRFTLSLAALLFSSALFSQLNMTLAARVDYMALHNAELNDCWGYVDETGKEYALVGTRKGTSVVDISNPSSPVEVAWFPGTESIWRDIQVWDDYAYVTTEADDGLLIIDLSPLPASTTLPTQVYFGEIGSIFTSAHDIFIDSEGYAYICGANRGNGGMIILDVHTDPMHPAEVGEFDMWYCHDAFAQGDLLYGAHISDGFLSIIDITDRSNPVLLNTQITPNSFTHNVWVTSNDQYAVTTDEIAGAFLTLYDVSNPNNIQEVDRIRSSPGLNIIPHNAFILADTLIVSSYYTDGITIHDMSRPHNLVEIASFDTNPLETGTFNGSWGAYAFLPSGLMLASDIEQGLFIIQPQIVPACYYEGLVRDASDLNALQDVTVTMSSDPQTDRSDINGQFAVGTVVPGTRTVTFYKVAYHPQTVTVNFVNGVLLTDTIDLVPIDPFNLNIMVKDLLTGDPVIGADIRITVPQMLQESQTNGFGEHGFELYYPGISDIAVGKWGYRTQCDEYNLDPATGTVTILLQPGIYDDFTFEFGWTVTDDGATSGKWERGIPVGSDGPATTPYDADFDCGEYAFVTGNGVGGDTNFDDVDGGRVTLYSPQFDLTAETDPYLHYHRWFHCKDGPVPPPDDTLEIFLSNGITTVLVDRALPDLTDYDLWISHSVHVSDFITPTANMQLILTVADEDPRVNITEAGIDFFYVASEDQVGVKEEQNEQLVLSPNPVSGALKITGLHSEEAFQLTDLTGKVIAEGMLPAGPATLDCSYLTAGMYLLNIDGRAIRFVKE